MDTNWSDILKAYRARTEFKMYDSVGNLVDSNRPMIESMVDDKTHRRGSFWYYMEDLMRDTSIRRDGNNIHVTCGTPLLITDGGAKHELTRSG